MTQFEYRFPIIVDSPLDTIKELQDSINTNLAAFGFHETKLKVRHPIHVMVLKTDRALTSEKITLAKAVMQIQVDLIPDLKGLNPEVTYETEE